MKLDQDWLQMPALRKVLAAIKGADGEARMVGGCVRDAIIGRKLGDFDLATTLKPEQVIATCEAAGCKVVPTGLKHGTVTVIAEHKVFEITTLRRDVATDGRHAEVEYTDDWQEDAARRDFTMNALFCDADGNITDFFHGLDDLKAGLVRFVGEPGQRIEEDVLRILRFFRFYAHYGTGPIDAAGLEACRTHARLLPGLSAERVRTELLKLLAAPDPVPSWKILIGIGALSALSLPLDRIDALERLIRHENMLNQPDALRRLFVLNSGNITAVAHDLRLSNAEAKRLKRMAGIVPANNVFKVAYQQGAQSVTDQLIIAGDGDAILINELQNWQRPEFPLNGAQLKTIGVADGPEMGRILHVVEEWWLENGFKPDLGSCLKRAKEVKDA